MDDVSAVARAAVMAVVRVALMVLMKVVLSDDLTVFLMVVGMELQ